MACVSHSIDSLIAVLANALTDNPGSKVLALVAYAWTGFGAAFDPLIILSLFWKRKTLNGVIAGIIIGAVTIILWKKILASTELYEIIPGFILSFASIVVVSLLEKCLLRKYCKVLNRYMICIKGNDSVKK
ncbi:hypothetical protein AY606_03510 [Acinetobacter sp. SFB]|nr:hypothetical protein AY606_03510 [Acinetobacter sp. SFB]